MQKLFVLDVTPSCCRIVCQGEWTHAFVSSVLGAKAWGEVKQKAVFDFSQVLSMDTAGALAWLRIKKELEVRGVSVEKVGIPKKMEKLISLCQIHSRHSLKTTPPSFGFSEGFVVLGKQTEALWRAFLSFVSFAGGAMYALLKTLTRPHKIRFRATLYHLEQSGLNALPIIIITALLIGVVIAYQGAVQLEKFGANIFIVEMVGIAATRELAPMIVAIVIAGRSASAFAAQIGVMKITDEVDAMKTMGFGPWEFLVLPRVVALVVAMPLLVLLGDGVAIFGGMLVARGELGISFVEFIDRFQETVALKHIVIGLVKAPIFGIIIALIGCYRGFQISSSTESVGKYTTISVVNAIFWVIAFNALFSVLLTELGI
ncbi:ABC transporter permease [Sulfurospirillum sp. T05]|uniref:ABC transporter permease n=1 Tax=Sulfurospirillum tamanense TaxID=2813362 RepID=A0ABS2WTC3_9BACT|nr:ABC transporter permease [Sulfurospirillum tamanensis]MBN2964909.1 ABC transporter permease [Sulfurospirillum tamanensis]